MSTLRSDLPSWRSLLFVPVTREKFVATAHRRGADAIILDLEDSVPESDKQRGRALVAAAAQEVSKGGADVLVRINRPWQHAFRDIEAVVSAGVAALVCPKVESPEHLLVIAEMLGALEPQRGLVAGHTKLVALIETAAAYFRADAIAKATPRLVALSLGAEDFAWSVGMEPIAEALEMPKQTVIIAARAAGILPLGFMGTVADFRRSRGFPGDRAPISQIWFCRCHLYSPQPTADPERGVRGFGRRCRARPTADCRLRGGHGAGARCAHL